MILAVIKINTEFNIAMALSSHRGMGSIITRGGVRIKKATGVGSNTYSQSTKNYLASE